MSSLLSKPSVIIWPSYQQELSIMITVSFIIAEVPCFICHFSGIKYKITVFCSLNFEQIVSENCSHTRTNSFIPEAVGYTNTRSSA